MSSSKDIEYSAKYSDDEFEFRYFVLALFFLSCRSILIAVLTCRHVILPGEVAKKLPKPMRLLSESEWRGLGVQQSLGWVHYEVHTPEPHVLLFRRKLGIDPTTGK